MRETVKPRVRSIAAKGNGGIANELRDAARIVEERGEPVAAWLVVLCSPDGSCTFRYDGPAEMQLVGALATAQQKIVGDW